MNAIQIDRTIQAERNVAELSSREALEFLVRCLRWERRLTQLRDAEYGPDVALRPRQRDVA